MKFTKLIKADSNPTPEALEIFKNAQAKAEQIASKYGYKADCWNFGDNPTSERPFREVRIIPNADLWPEGWIRYDYWKDNELKAEIQTTSYGALSLEVYTEYLDHCRKALECLKELKETFFK